MLDYLLARAQLASPHDDPAEQDRAVAVAEVAEQPPQTLRATAVPVRDDGDAGPDPSPAGGNRKPLGGRQRVSSRALDREIRQVVVHVEERCAGDVPAEIELPPAPGIAELPPAVDELDVARHSVC